MYKVILKFENNPIKEIESIEFETFNKAFEAAKEGEGLYRASSYEIVEL